MTEPVRISTVIAALQNILIKHGDIQFLCDKPGVQVYEGIVPFVIYVNSNLEMYYDDETGIDVPPADMLEEYLPAAITGPAI